METTARIGRNEPCPCGSGKKYKACCERRVDVAQKPRGKSLRMVGATVLALVVAGTVALAAWREDEAAAEAPASITSAPAVLPATTNHPLTSGKWTPQPPGPVPAGKVWSHACGHWHDVPNAVPPSAPTPITPIAAPPVVPQ